jgi:hypothetical protein
MPNLKLASYFSGTCSWDRTKYDLSQILTPHSYLNCKNEIFLFQTNEQYLFWWTIFVTGMKQDRKYISQHSLLSDDNVESIHPTSLHSPRKSVRKLSHQNRWSYGSLQAATNIIKFPPHHRHVMHELNRLNKSSLYCSSMVSPQWTHQ